VKTPAGHIRVEQRAEISKADGDVRFAPHRGPGRRLPTTSHDTCNSLVILDCHAFPLLGQVFLCLYRRRCQLRVDEVAGNIYAAMRAGR